MTIIIPKWMGSIPKFFTTGRKIGAKISTAGVISINIPAASNSRLISSRITYLLSETLSSACPIAFGSPVKDNTNDMTADAAIRNIMTAVVSHASRRIPGRSEGLMDL